MQKDGRMMSRTEGESKIDKHKKTTSCSKITETGELSHDEVRGENGRKTRKRVRQREAA